MLIRSPMTTVPPIAIDSSAARIASTARLVGRLLVPEARLAGGRHRCGLGDRQELEPRLRLGSAVLEIASARDTLRGLWEG